MQPIELAAAQTEEGQREIVNSINRIHETTIEVEDKKCNNLKGICYKQLEYFMYKDNMINITQQGLVRALEGLTIVLGESVKNRAFPQERVPLEDVEMRPSEYLDNSPQSCFPMEDPTNDVHASSECGMTPTMTMLTTSPTSCEAVLKQIKKTALV
jgi:hypothetical protein